MTQTSQYQPNPDDIAAQGEALMRVVVCPGTNVTKPLQPTQSRLQSVAVSMLDTTAHWMGIFRTLERGRYWR